jgi:hypothetical protein
VAHAVFVEGVPQVCLTLTNCIFAVKTVFSFTKANMAFQKSSQEVLTDGLSFHEENHC